MPAFAATTEHTLLINREPVNKTGKTVDKITINGGIAGPVLAFTEGDTAVIHVENKLDKPISVHWHGLLLPPEMDGVPGLGSYAAITQASGLLTSSIYANGTQAQEGLYGALIVHPKVAGPVQADLDYVALSDFSEETGQQIISIIKKSPHYYNYSQHTVGDFLLTLRRKALNQRGKLSVAGNKCACHRLIWPMFVTMHFCSSEI
ncbi:MAG: multicopper oxidase domain-containing protein [Methylophaga sp.]|nr:multicopper oxidase domain-containing protein [Methylophaga sp.]